VTLSQIVHPNLRCRFELDANFDKQRRLIAYALMLQPVCVARWSARLRVFSNSGLSLGADDRREVRCV